MTNSADPLFWGHFGRHDTRRIFAMRLVALLAALALPAAAPDEKAVLRAPEPRMLYDYLMSRARERFDARRATVASLKTPEDIRRRQGELKGKFLEALGGFPAKGPLNPRVVGRGQRDGYR